MSVPARSVRWDLEGPHTFVIVDAEAEGLSVAPSLIATR
ncbi:MAG: hypothetical protein CM15mP74_14660 [Halieaceae bacterium]|nr:MAG: hypothetical protein CM15mP74_14660 [Halieaceae bacterium]